MSEKSGLSPKMKSPNRCSNPRRETATDTLVFTVDGGESRK